MRLICYPIIGIVLFLALLLAFRNKIPRSISCTRTNASAELLFLQLAILIGCLVVYGSFIFGTDRFIYFDSGMDTIQQYVPFYIDVINDIQDGKFSPWNFDYGLGANVFVTQTWLCDPFNWILILAGVALGIGSVPLLLVLVQIIRLLVLGLLFDRLLIFYCKRPIARIMGALLVAFSGYTVNETHYWFGTAFVLLCLMLLAFELLAHKRSTGRIVFFSLSVALLLVSSVYLGVMSLIFLVFYAPVRLVFVNPRFHAKKYIKELLFLVMVAISGCLIACIILLPVAQTLYADSVRINNGQGITDKVFASLVGWCPFKDVPFRLSRFASSNLIYTGRDIIFGGGYYDLQIGCSILVFVFGLMYCWQALKSTCRISRRILMLLPVLFVILYCFNDLLPSMFNVFASTTRRNSFALIIIICLGIAYVIDRVVVPRKAPSSIVIVGALFTTAVLALSFYCAMPAGQLVCIVEVAFLVASIALLLIYQKKGRSYLLVAFLVIVFASALFDSFLSVNYRYSFKEDFLPISSAALENDSTQQAVNWIRQHDESLYRIDETYEDLIIGWQNNWIYGYNGVSSYNTVMTHSQILFFENCWPGINTSDETYYLLNFENDWDHPGILAFLNVRYLLSHEVLTADYLEEIAQVDDVLIYKNTRATAMGYVYGSAMAEEDASKLSSTERSALIGDTLIIPDDKAALIDRIFDSTGDLSLSMVNEGNLVGRAQANAGAIAAVSIPYDVGWHVLIDDVETEGFPANYGFIGFEIPAGEHEIEISYMPHGMHLGLVLAGVGLLLLVLLSVASHSSIRATRGKDRP